MLTYNTGRIVQCRYVDIDKNTLLLPSRKLRDIECGMRSVIYKLIKSFLMENNPNYLKYKDNLTLG